MYECTPNSNVNSQANSKVKVYLESKLEFESEPKSQLESQLESKPKNKLKSELKTSKPTFPVFLCATILDTVTVTVLFMTPHLVTIPVKVAGGIFLLPSFCLFCSEILVEGRELPR